MMFVMSCYIFSFDQIFSFLLPGCLQSIYGIHTFRVESIARGKAAPVDELQVQGISDPDLLRKVKQNMFLDMILYNFGD